jgi:predicted kinase
MSQHSSHAILYIFGGLPGTGKSELAQSLAHHTNSAYLRVDTIEQAIKNVCGSLKYDEGYQAAFDIASDNLRNGTSVIADSVNAISASREAWKKVATQLRVKYIQIEVQCSDKAEHRIRVENRKTTVSNLKLPTWNDVLTRHYEPWNDVAIIIDTANEEPHHSFNKLISLF